MRATTHLPWNWTHALWKLKLSVTRLSVINTEYNNHMRNNITQEENSLRIARNAADDLYVCDCGSVNI